MKQKPFKILLLGKLTAHFSDVINFASRIIQIKCMAIHFLQNNIYVKSFVKY